MTHRDRPVPKPTSFLTFGAEGLQRRSASASSQTTVSLKLGGGIQTATITFPSEE